MTFGGRAAAHRPITAIHEAGHAVMAWTTQRQLGYRHRPFGRVLVRTPDEITAGPNADDKGRTQCMALTEPHVYHQNFGVDGRMRELYQEAYRRDGRAPAIVQRSAEAEMLTALAGPAAEAEYRSLSSLVVILGSGKDDWERAVSVAADVVPNGDHGQYVEAIYARAVQLLRDPVRWSAVVAVADALVEVGELEAQEVLSIMQDKGAEQ